VFVACSWSKEKKQHLPLARMIFKIYLPGQNDDVLLAATLPSLAFPSTDAGVVFSFQFSAFHGAGTMTNYKLKVE